MKRLFDLVFALFFIIIFSWLTILIAIAIRIVLGKPILFSQIRPGLNEIPFTIYKFRTMREFKKNVDNSDKERLTKLGEWLRKTSLDELPSLFNVVKGEMSLVGPRPLLLEYLPLYNSEQSRRHEVRPGITGWAQVNGRNAISWEDKFKLDVWYIENQSFYLDVKVLFLTLFSVFRFKDITQDGHVTSEKFRGSK